MPGRPALAIGDHSTRFGMTRMDEPDPQPETILVRPGEAPSTTTRPLVPDLALSVVYEIDGLDHVDAIYQGESAGDVYARDGHPNASRLASKIAALEGAEAALVCASGMAAEAAALLSALDAGDRVALSEGVYGKTVALVAKELARFGVAHSLFDPTRPETLKAALADPTRVVFLETISNPLLRVADIAGLADIAHEANALLFVDQTFAPLICRAIPLGADVVTHSATKLIGGHSDVTLGVVAGSKAFIDRGRSLASTFGLTGNPFESWLARADRRRWGSDPRRCASALTLAERLENHPGIRVVHYPGLPSHADYELARKMLRGGFGTIVTIDLGDRSAVDRFIRGLMHIPFAPSLGDVSTTLSHPASTSHRGQSPEQWARRNHSRTRPLVDRSRRSRNLWEDLSRALGG